MGSLQQDITPSCPSNYGPGGDGQPCTTNITEWTSPENLQDSIILKDYVNELRSAVNGEETRREGESSSFNTASTGTIINSTDLVNLKNAIDTFEKYDSSGNLDGYKSFTWTNSSPNQEDIIENELTEEMRSKINDAENDCLCNCNYCTCNCDYCTCNCDYCTCNCDYCTCDCDYCTCDCDYSCTCNCNYSS